MHDPTPANVTNMNWGEPVMYRVSRTIGVWLLLIALVFAAAVVVRAVPASGSDPVTVHAGCVLRGDGGWHIHTNSTHACTALMTQPIVQSDGDLSLRLVGG